MPKILYKNKNIGFISVPVYATSTISGSDVQNPQAFSFQKFSPETFKIEVNMDLENTYISTGFLIEAFKILSSIFYFRDPSFFFTLIPKFFCLNIKTC